MSLSSRGRGAADDPVAISSSSASSSWDDSSVFASSSSSSSSDRSSSSRDRLDHLDRDRDQEEEEEEDEDSDVSFDTPVTVPDMRPLPHCHGKQRTRASCKACCQLKYLQGSQTTEGLETQPSLEAFFEGFWWDVEAIRAAESPGSYMIRCVGFKNSQVAEIGMQRIRLRSRRASASDCSKLKEGVDVCVFAIHPATNEKAWYDGRIKRVVNKPHDLSRSPCKCRFLIYLYRIGDTVSGEDMKMVMDKAQLLGIDRMKILQAPRSIDFEAVLKAATRRDSMRRRHWARDIGSIKDKIDLHFEDSAAAAAAEKDLVWETDKNGNCYSYEVSSSSEDETDKGYDADGDDVTEFTEGADLSEFASFLENEIRDVAQVDKDGVVLITSDCEVEEPKKRKKMSGRERGKTRGRAADDPVILIDRPTRKHASAEKSSSRKRAGRSEKEKEKRRKKAKEHKSQLQKGKKRRLEGLFEGETVPNFGKAKLRRGTAARVPKVVEEDPDEDDLDVEQGYFSSLADYWKRSAVTVENEVKTAEEMRLERLWSEMKMAFRKTSKPETSEKERFVGRFEGCCEEHDLVMDEQVGYVCSQCGFIAIHIDRLAAHPEAAMRRMCFPGTDSKDDDFTPANMDGKQIDDFLTSKLVLKEMHDHQKRAVQFLKRSIVDENAGCILAHSPGTGKTFTTIAFYSRFKEMNPNCRLLVLAPKGVLKAWKREFRKWNVGIPVHLVTSGDHKTSRREILSQWQRERSVLVMSYALFVSLGESSTKKKNLSNYVLQIPDVLILDEGHCLKGAKTRLRRTIMKVRTKRRIMLSGTLFQNNFNELFNIMYVVRPSFIRQLDGYEDFELFSALEREQNAEMLEDRARKWFMQEIGTKFNQGNNRELEAAREKLISMTGFIDHYKGEVLKSLPGLYDYTITLSLSETQIRVLEKLEELFPNRMDGEYLCTITCIHPYLLTYVPRLQDYETVQNLQSGIEAGRKMEFVMKVIELCKLTSEKVLVFSQCLCPFDYLTSTMESKLGWTVDKEILRIDGALNPNERQDRFEKFNRSNDDSRICLASITTCAEGITLTGASRVIFLHTVWNASMMNQAISRAYRLGQKRPVFVYRLVARLPAEIRKDLRTVWKDWVSENIFTQGDSNRQLSKMEIFQEDTLLGKLSEEKPHLIVEVIRRAQAELEQQRAMQHEGGF